MPKKINSDLLNNIGKPKDLLDGLLNNQVEQVEAELGAQFRGIGNKILSLFVQNGNRLQLSALYISEKIGNKIDEDTICQVLDKLVDANLLRFSGDNTYEIANNMLAKRAYQKVEGTNLLLRQMEAMVRNRIERDVLLDEDDLKYLENSLDLLELTPEERQFVDDSYTSIRKKKRRLYILIFLAFALLSTLSAFLWYAENRASKYYEQAKLQNEQLELTNQQLLRSKQSLDTLILDLNASYQELERAKDSAELLRDAAIKAQILERAARILADSSRSEAEKARARAEMNALNADNSARIAERERQTAELLRDEADLRRRQLDTSLKRTEAFNAVVISRNIANRSLQEEDAVKRTIIALQTYYINEDSEFGDSQHPSIMKALYSAAQKMDPTLQFSLANQHFGGIKDIVVHPFRDIIYTTGSDGNLIEWSVSSWNRVGAPNVSSRDLERNSVGTAVNNSLALNSIGSQLIAGGELPLIKVFNTRNGFPEDYFFPAAQEIFQVGHLPENNQILAYSQDSIYILNSDNSFEAYGKVSTKINRIFNDGPNAYPISFRGLNRPGEYVIEFSLFENRGFTVDSLSFFDHRFEALSAVNQYSYDDKGTVAFGFRDGQILIFDWDIDQLSTLSEKFIFDQHISPISDIEFSHDGQYMAVASFDGTVSVWDMNRYRNPSYLPMVFDFHEGWALSLAFSNDDRVLMVGDQQGSLTFWSLNPEDYSTKLCEDMRSWSRDRSKYTLPTAEWQRYFGDIEQRAICR